MREARFIKNNVEKWNRYQQEPSKDPDETAGRFMTLMDDLSYARTFYPASKVAKWINGMAVSIYQQIYITRSYSIRDFIFFWKYHLPLLFRKRHKFLLGAFLLFAGFVVIGAMSSIIDPDYARNFFNHHVQQGYYDATLRNIDSGDPFGVYRDEHPFSMFVWIAFNNIAVAFRMVVGGLAGGLGTLWMMWQNGIMLGCFQYIFFSQGLGWQSVLVIWIHGTLEISSVVIASCAGLVLGLGWLFPGTYTRRQAFIRSAADAMQICVALVPFFIVAAFFESYITQLMSNTFSGNDLVGLPVPVSILILAGSLLLIAWYFIWYPIQLERRGFKYKKESLTKQHKGNDK